MAIATRVVPPKLVPPPASLRWIVDSSVLDEWRFKLLMVHPVVLRWLYVPFLPSWLAFECCGPEQALQ